MAARPGCCGTREELHIRASCHFVPSLVLSRVFAWLLVPKENQSVEYSNIKLIPLSAQVAEPVSYWKRRPVPEEQWGWGGRGEGERLTLKGRGTYRKLLFCLITSFMTRFHCP